MNEHEQGDVQAEVKSHLVVQDDVAIDFLDSVNLTIPHADVRARNCSDDVPVNAAAFGSADRVNVSCDSLVVTLDMLGAEMRIARQEEWNSADEFVVRLSPVHELMTGTLRKYRHK